MEASGTRRTTVIDWTIARDDVLGWSNEAKIAALEQEAQVFQERLKVLAGELAQNEQEQKALESRQIKLQQLSVFESFRDLDWKPLAVEIDLLQTEKRQLEEGSDILLTLNSAAHKDRTGH